MTMTEIITDFTLNVSTSVSQDGPRKGKSNTKDKSKVNSDNFPTPSFVSKAKRGPFQGFSKTNNKSTGKELVNVDGFDDVKQHEANKPHTSGGRISSLFGNNPDIPVFAQRAVKPVTEAVFSTKHFKDLRIHPFTISNLSQNMGLEKLTMVQQMCIPVLLCGRDALVRSQTGSGKTLAYALPIVETLQAIRPKLARGDGIRAVIVVPTRELALQTYECLIKLVKPFTWLVPGCLVGGEKRKSEKARLRKGITILVGTPGRLLDHIEHTESLHLDKVCWLVLDEADRLLDMGYEKEVASLVSALDAQRQRDPWKRPVDADKLDDQVEDEEIDKPETIRQTVLLSATLTSAVERLAGLTLKSPEYVDAASERDPGQGTSQGHVDTSDMVIPETLSQSYIVTPAKLRLVTLAAFIVWKCQMTDQRKMLIFCATQDMVDFHTELLSSVLKPVPKISMEDIGFDYEVEEEHIVVDVCFFRLHGSMTQKERTEVFKTFRDANSGVLLCTDVAARGLDLPHVDWILQYTAPCTAADYVHRVGRTARVGTAGSALLFLTPNEVEFVRQLEDRRLRLQELPMEKCLEFLQLGTQPLGRRNQRLPQNVESAATALHMRFENAVVNRPQLHALACKAYVSWVRFYATYPKDVKEIFDFKGLHLGHYAKSFALRDPPSTIGGIGKRQASLDPNKRPRKTGPRDKARTEQTGPQHHAGKSRIRELIVSEFSSGLEPAKKKLKLK